MIQLKRDHTELRWALIQWLLCLWTQTHTEGRTACENTGRHWREIATSQGFLAPPEAGREQGRIPSQSPQICTVLPTPWPWTCSLQDRRIHFCCFKSPQLGYFGYDSPGKWIQSPRRSLSSIPPPSAAVPSCTLSPRGSSLLPNILPPFPPPHFIFSQTDQPTNQPFFHLEEIKHFPPFWTHFLFGRFSPLLSPLRFHSTICSSCLPHFHTAVYGGRSVDVQAWMLSHW